MLILELAARRVECKMIGKKLWQKKKLTKLSKALKKASNTHARQAKTFRNNKNEKRRWS